MVVNYHQQTSYILNHIGDEDSNVDDREYVAFLNMWLKRFIFCGSSCGPTYNHKYLAERLAARNENSPWKVLVGVCLSSDAPSGCSNAER
jgi:hypothetical protein